MMNRIQSTHKETTRRISNKTKSSSNLPSVSHKGRNSSGICKENSLAPMFPFMSASHALTSSSPLASQGKPQCRELQQSLTMTLRVMMVDSICPLSLYICTLTKAIPLLLRKMTTRVTILVIRNRMLRTMVRFQERHPSIKMSLQPLPIIAWGTQFRLQSGSQMLVSPRPCLEINSKLISHPGFCKANFMVNLMPLKWFPLNTGSLLSNSINMVT